MKRARYIDSDKLLQNLKQWAENLNSSRNCGTAEEIWCTEAKIDVLDTVIDDIESERIVDVAPVLQAKWVKSKYETISERGRIIKVTTVACSYCEKSNGRAITPYCPNCGAKMEGGNENA